MTEAELAESISLGGRAVHPVRHPGRATSTTRSSTPAAPTRGRQTMDVLLVAAEEGQDRRLHRRHRRRPAARRSSSTSDAFARAELPSRPTTGSTRGGRRAAQRRRAAPSTSTSSAATSRSSRATSRSAATPTPRRCRRSSASPFEAAEQLKRGRPIDGASTEDAAAGAARGDRERAARESRRRSTSSRRPPRRPHRSRRCVCGGASRVEGFAELHRRAVRHRRSSSSTRSRRSRSTPASSAARRRLTPRRPPRSPSASRCGRWATDDSHQPPRAANARSRSAAAVGFDIGQKVTLGLQPDSRRDGARHRLVVVGARSRSRRG